ncbi:unnamed protein product [Cochlearia groenlandica]
MSAYKYLNELCTRTLNQVSDRIPLGGTLLRTRLSKELWRMNGAGGYGGGLQVKNEAADDGEKREDGI